MSLTRRCAALTAAAALALLAAAPGASAATSDTVWGCLPGATPNLCEGSLATTVLSSTLLQPRRVARVEDPAPDATRDTDCFYLYPTVAGNLGWSAPKRVTDEVREILQAHAARFSQVCRVYAPVYRQVTTAGIAAQTLTQQQGPPSALIAAGDRAFSDVRAAWRDYLANHNNGRGVTLVAHSQGSFMLARLLREEIDRDPAQRSLLVSVIAPGGNFAVRRGERAGGDAQHIPTCSRAGETGCVVAYSTYGSLPSRTARYGTVQRGSRAAFGLPVTSDLEVACVNPAALSGDRDRLRTMMRAANSPTDADLFDLLAFYGAVPWARTPWVVPGDRYSAACITHNGANVLRVRAAGRGSVVPFPAPYPDWGLHTLDIELAFGNLVEIVRAQREAYMGRA
jgi:hypothetical protein